MDGTIDSKEFPGFSEEEQKPRIFEVEGNVFDYEQIANTARQVGKSFLDRFYSKILTEDKKKELLDNFYSAISKEHPIDPRKILELPGDPYHYPVVLKFQEEYDVSEIGGEYCYGDDNSLMSEVEGKPVVGNPIIKNYLRLAIDANPQRVEEMQKLPNYLEHANHFITIVKDYTQDIPKLINGLEVREIQGVFDNFEFSKGKYPTAHSLLNFDENLLNTKRGKVNITVRPELPAKAKEQFTNILDPEPK